MSDSLKIAIIVGSVRAERQSIHVGSFLYDIAQEYKEVETTLIDPLKYEYSASGELTSQSAETYVQTVRESDGFWIVTPEYNYSYPGPLKNVLDAAFEEYFYKAAGLVGVSSGQWGGTRAVELLSHPLRKMKLYMAVQELYFPNVGTLFVDGKCNDESYIDRAKKTFEELLWLSKELRSIRRQKAQ